VRRGEEGRQRGGGGRGPRWEGGCERKGRVGRKEVERCSGGGSISGRGVGGYIQWKVRRVGVVDDGMLLKGREVAACSVGSRRKRG
jgi:hypothetical protein